MKMATVAVMMEKGRASLIELPGKLHGGQFRLVFVFATAATTRPATIPFIFGSEHPLKTLTTGTKKGAPVLATTALNTSIQKWLFAVKNTVWRY
jgi:hypothetical protein